jgi:hypothetical protein
MNEARRPSRRTPAEAAQAHAAPEQRRYADVLDVGVRAGFLLLVVSFALYLAGVPQPLVPVDRLPQYWGLPVGEFVKATHTPTGWGWLAMVGTSDMLNLVGITVLAAAPAFASLAVLPVFGRRRELALLAIALLQVVVLALAASSLLGAH